MLFEEPFTTYPGWERDPGYNGTTEEIQEYWGRESMIWDFLHGRTGCMEVYDAINESTMDVVEYIDSVEWNINFIMANGIQPTDTGLWLPKD
jgi:hypothetical protein